MPRKSKATTVEKPAPVEEVPTPEESEAPVNGGDDRRSFRIIADSIRAEGSSPAPTLSNGGGRYTGRTPGQAAKKAFSAICRSTGQGPRAYVFSIQEARASRKNGVPRTFTYRGERVKLAEPQTTIRSGNTYTINYNNVVRAHRESATEVAPSPPAAPQQEETPAEASSVPPQKPRRRRVAKKDA